MVRFWAVTVAALLAITTAATAQEKTEAKPEEKPKTLLEELTLFGYVENSYVWNLGQSSTAKSSGGLTYARRVNTLRLYDSDEGYTFNMAEFSLKKDPSDRYPFGFGVVLNAGEDTQKNHSVGIFRDLTDKVRQTNEVDLEEAYLAYKIPLGSGLTIKAGKFVTLLSYEVIESPNNLNFSRSLLFSFAVPFTHTGGLLSYTFTDWFSVTAGVVEGWDVADDNNASPSYIGQFAFTLLKDLSTNLNWIVGPEQTANDTRQRWVTDITANYAGFKNVTLGLNIDIAGEDKEASLVAAGRRDRDATWWGWAGYAAYDWTEKLRSALRLEYFDDAQSVRTLARSPGSRTAVYEVTATMQYKIWRGLVGRLEYRHDDANAKVFGVRSSGGNPTRTAQDTISIDLYYLFF